MKKIFGLIVLLTCISLLPVGVFTAEEAPKGEEGAPKEEAAPPKVGDAAFNFSLKEGGSEGMVDLKSLGGPGSPVVIAFTNSVCAACRKEMTELAKFQGELEQPESITLVAIIVDSSGEKGVERMKATFGEAYRYLMDPEFSVPGKFGFDFTPALVIVGNDGKIAHLVGGYSAEKMGEVKAMLGKLGAK